MNYIESDELNNAKKKILYLLKTKYKDPNTEYIETDDTDTDSVFMTIVNGIDKSRILVLQLITFLSKKADDVAPLMIQTPRLKKNGDPAIDKNGNPILDTVQDPNGAVVVTEHQPYYKTIPSYQNFNQMSLNLDDNLKKINYELSKLINNIGYVEPENMNKFRSYYEDLMKGLTNLIGLTIKKINQNEYVYNVVPNNAQKMTSMEMQNMSQLYDSVRIQKEKLIEHATQISSTYNYKSNNVENKRNPQSIESTGASLIVEEE